jgi:hypothetical protein
VRDSLLSPEEVDTVPSDRDSEAAGLPLRARSRAHEGAFTTPFPEQAGEVLMALLQGMGDAHARLLFVSAEERQQQRRVEAIVATHAA